ncbi:hypothetical protein MUU74_04785 [Chryseobacterium daecheongense]|uniref:hypothetical protein n=1 Tax=Chryseobacterium daecheongense TaxID=192389 RepID=UPI001FD63FB0|nr:hypothetical protein [Chryseobacterium daecheongense]UOU99277.1 hypothetical protein MUU74_04785 [Chryseobacterium daecheongense]
MKILIYITLLFLSFTGLKAQQSTVPSVKYEELEKRIQQEGDKFLVVNFLVYYLCSLRERASTLYGSEQLL